MLAAYLVNDLVKSAFHEQRPCRTLHVITVDACPALRDRSFPSNHAATAAATAIRLTDRRLGTVALAAALLMGASRVWVGAHYPHDVLIGLLAGVLVSWPLTVAARRCAPAVVRLRDSRLRPLVAAGCSRAGSAHGMRRTDPALPAMPSEPRPPPAAAAVCVGRRYDDAGRRTTRRPAGS